jgi:hypothetical protein
MWLRTRRSQGQFLPGAPKRIKHFGLAILHATSQMSSNVRESVRVGEVSSEAFQCGTVNISF